MKKATHAEDMAEVYARADVLTRLGASVDKAVRYLNAEFNLCFYANKNTVWTTFLENGKPEYRRIGTFA